MSSQLQPSTIKISASLLSADFSRLGEEIAALDVAGIDYIHIDVMDGHFVPNLTIGPCVINAIRKKTSIPFDVHLMLQNPEDVIDDYIDVGSDIVTIHLETVKHVHRLLDRIKARGKKVGISILPSISEHVLQYLIEEVDLILVMTVDPGFAGAKFIKSQLTKISNIRNMLNNANKDIILSVDGGINAETAPHVIRAGANMLVSGSHIFSASDYKTRVNKLRAL